MKEQEKRVIQISRPGFFRPNQGMCRRQDESAWGWSWCGIVRDLLPPPLLAWDPGKWVCPRPILEAGVQSSSLTWRESGVRKPLLLG